MGKQKDLSTLPANLKLEVAERIAQYFKEGVFEFDLDTEGHIVVEGNTVYHVVPHFAEEDSESIVNRLRRIIARNLEESG